MLWIKDIKQLLVYKPDEVHHLCRIMWQALKGKADWLTDWLTDWLIDWLIAQGLTSPPTQYRLFLGRRRERRIFWEHIRSVLFSVDCYYKQYISSTSLYSLSSWFTSSCAYRLITVIMYLCSHHLSLPRPFTADLKLISFTNPFLHSHSYSFRAAFTNS